MNPERSPIDHKDDSPEYRAQVWEAVTKRVGSSLTALPIGTRLKGPWDVEFDVFGQRQPIYQYNFQDEDRVVIKMLMGANLPPQTETYRQRAEGQMTIAGETYHAATLESGELVLFNGDQSLVLIAKKQ